MTDAKKKMVAASQVAAMAFCERQVLLRHRVGDRKTPEQARAAAHGVAVHERIYLEGHVPQRQEKAPMDSRCFIATAVFGADAPETRFLREFRDARLRGGFWGEAFISAYYRLSPKVASLLRDAPILAEAVRRVLRVLIGVLK